MFRTLFALAALSASASALAQNEVSATTGKAVGEWNAAPTKANRAVTFTATGNYADLDGARLIEVRADGDRDGDGAPDAGVLRVACNGGDILTGTFSKGGAASADGAKPGSGAAALAAGKSFKGSWGVRPGSTSVTIGSDQPNLCA